MSSHQDSGDGNAGQGVAVERDDDIEEDYDYTYGYGEHGYEIDDYPAYDYEGEGYGISDYYGESGDDYGDGIVMKPLNQNSVRSSTSPLICTRENMTMKLNKS